MPSLVSIPLWKPLRKSSERMKWCAPSLMTSTSSLQTHIALAPFTQRCNSTCTRTLASGSTAERPKWRGGEDTDVLPTQQGIIVLGTPLGDVAFIQAHLEMKAVDWIPLMSDLQSMVDSLALRVSSLALRVGESHLLAQGGRAPGGGRVCQNKPTTTFGVVCVISST